MRIGNKSSIDRLISGIRAINHFVHNHMTGTSITFSWYNDSLARYRLVTRWVEGGGAINIAHCLAIHWLRLLHLTNT